MEYCQAANLFREGGADIRVFLALVPVLPDIPLENGSEPTWRKAYKKHLSMTQNSLLSQIV